MLGDEAHAEEARSVEEDRLQSDADSDPEAEGCHREQEEATNPFTNRDGFDVELKDAPVNPLNPVALIPAARKAVSRSSGKVGTDRPSIANKKRTVAKNKKPAVARKLTLPQAEEEGGRKPRRRRRIGNLDRRWPQR